MSITLPATRPTGWRRMAHLARRAWLIEVHGYQNAWRFVFRRPRVPAGATGFSYAQPVLPVLIVFIAVSAVEVVVVDLIVHRWWPAGRLPLLVLGIWGVTFMVGLLFGMLVRPHAVGPAGLRIRSGSEVDLALSWDDVAAITRRTRRINAGQPKVTVDESGEATLHLRISDETNLDVRLERPATLRLPHGVETVSAVSLYADDPRGFLAEARRYL